MALYYTEFDSTVQTVLRDIRTAILGSSDWADIGSTAGSTLSSAVAAAATTVPVVSSASFAVGQIVVFEPGTANEERRAVATVPNGTSITVAALSFAHASGTTMRNGAILLKATTTRGADMIVDLAGGVPVLNGILPTFYRAHDGVTGTDPTQRYCFWRSNATSSALSNPVHVVVSASKEHLFVSIEGPRAWETGATSTVYGSAKQYFFLADLVPYFAADTLPVVVLGAQMNVTPQSAVTTNSHIASVSRNAANTSSWVSARVATLSYLDAGTTDVFGVKRECSIDGNTYMFPFVVIQDTEGVRGRLNNLFYAGNNSPTPANDITASVGDKSTFDGRTYKTVTVNNSDGSANTFWGALGAVANGSANANRSIIVGLPVA